MATLIRDKYEAHKAEVNARFDQLRANEEELNRIFAEIYNMVGEVPIAVEDKYVSVARIFDTADEIPESFKGNNYVRTRRDEIVSLISYAVGCMFGRYSLDVDGLVLADQGDTVREYLARMSDPEHVSFMPVTDNVLAITDGAYFDNDICTLFERFSWRHTAPKPSRRTCATWPAPPPRRPRHRARDGARVLPEGVLRRPLQDLQEAPHLLAARRRQEKQLQGTLLHAPLPARPHGARAHGLRACAAGTPPAAASPTSRTRSTLPAADKGSARQRAACR